MLRSVIEEERVTRALQKAGNTYPRVWEAFEALCWILVRREMSPGSNPVIRDVYRLHKQGPGKYGVPGLTVIYTVSPENIHLHSLRVN